MKFDGFVKSRHSGLPVPGRQVKTGVQGIYKHLNPALSGTGFRLEFIPMKIGAGMTEKGI